MATKAKKIIRIFVVIIFVIGIFGIIEWIIWESYQNHEVLIVTDSIKYQLEGALRVRIENNSEDLFCFSSQIPYYLERKKELAWISYKYAEVLEERRDLIIRCVDSKKVKAFKLYLFGGEGVHRLTIPMCVNCKIGDEFKRDKVFYSNSFLVK